VSASDSSFHQGTGSLGALLAFLHAGVLISFSCREAKAAVTFTIFLLVTKGLCPVFLH
jgi:hypothetical protein